MNLGEKIKQLREANNLSKEELAKECELSINEIDCFENGNKEPSLAEIKKISQVLNVAIDDLLDNNIKYIIYKKESNVEKLAGFKLETIDMLKNIFKKIFIFLCWFAVLSFYLWLIIDATSS